MKLKEFEEFVNETLDHSGDYKKMSNEQLDFLQNWCSRVFRSTGNTAPSWKLNSNGTVNVNGEIKVSHVDMKQIPVKLGTVYGSVELSNIKELTSLEGWGRDVKSSFKIQNCPDLKTLKGLPLRIGGEFVIVNCPQVPKEEIEVCKDPEMKKLWIKSKMNIEDFLHSKRGIIRGRKFGI